MRALLFTVTFCFCTLIANAQEFPAIYVYAEDDTDDEVACQISNQSVVSAVEAELRHNRIDLATGEQYVKAAAISGYVKLASIKTSSGLCVVAYNFSLQNYQKIVVDVTQQPRMANVEFCSLGGVMTGTAATFQGRLNTQYRDLTSECVSKYLKE